MTQNNRRVVITGLGVISPVGNTPEKLWESLYSSSSGVDFLHRIPGDKLPSKIGGEARDFSGSIDDFGELEKKLKRTIKKGLKLMCREIEMGVASAQLAIADAGLSPGAFDPVRIGTMFGCDYIVTEPTEFSTGIHGCVPDGEFDFNLWGDHGLNKVEPLWLLKYLPNMPASHVAIYNDLQGPSNSLTVREASANIALAEATTILKRGIADYMVVGATGSRIHPLRSVHVALQEELAQCEFDGTTRQPAEVSRPFESDRFGMVMGEGAGSIVLEDYDNAIQRGAAIYGEVVGYGSSTVADRNYVADYGKAFSNVIQSALESSSLDGYQLGHVNAHGLSTVRCDKEEAMAISGLLGEQIPVVAAKSNMGNLGAGGGMVELVASLKALEADRLFPVLNLDHQDAECRINLVTSDDVVPGDCFINLNVSPQGQASSVIVKRI